jgi:hypothetical protein
MKAARGYSPPSDWERKDKEIPLQPTGGFQGLACFCRYGLSLRARAVHTGLFTPINEYQRRTQAAGETFYRSCCSIILFETVHNHFKKRQINPWREGEREGGRERERERMISLSLCERNRSP